MLTFMKAVSPFLVYTELPYAPNSPPKYLPKRNGNMLIKQTNKNLILESIMLSEVSQAVKDKYHMISPISGT